MCERLIIDIHVHVRKCACAECNTLRTCIIRTAIWLFYTDPYSSMTPDALQSMTLASDARGKSQGIRQELHKAIEQTQRLQQASHDTVNEGLTRKLAQTVTLTVSST